MEKNDAGLHRPPGEILSDLRKVLAPQGARKLTQAQLAERLSYNQEYVQAMETGRRPVQPHFVEELARLDDDARFPDAFARLLEELRGSVAAYWDAQAARPPDIGASPGAKLGTTVPAAIESVASTLGGKLDALRDTMDGLSARSEGRLDGLGGKLDRTEGTLSALGGKLDRTEGTLAVLGTRLEATSSGFGALGAKVEEASGKAEKGFGVLGSKVDAASDKTVAAVSAVGAKLDVASARTEGLLHGLAANVADAGDKLDRTDAKIESVRTQAAQAEKKVTGKLDLLSRLLCANVGLGVVGVAALFILHCHRVPSAVHPAQGGTANTGVAQGAAEAGAQEREADDPMRSFPGLARDASGDLGKKTAGEKWIPPEPFPEQDRGPCHEAEGEETINGGCWFKSGNVKPPCGLLYRHRDSCYRPILKAPRQPLGEEPHQAVPERQGP
ncbi:MAG TPA: helix-turn-helix transcriptional regulator [Myxococcaceae bacterium]|nr:helix-turn-helix transcriptional regulator [Myxococcaceae bacterium]